MLVSCGSLHQPALVLQLLSSGWNLGSLPSQWLRTLSLWGQREGQGGGREDVVPWQGEGKHPAGHVCFRPVLLGCSQKGLPPIPLAPHPLAEPYSHPRMPLAWQHYPGIGECPVDTIPIRWAGRLGLPLFRADTALGALPAGSGLETAGCWPQSLGGGFGMGLFSSPDPCTKVLEALGGNFPLLPLLSEGKGGNFPPFPFFSPPLRGKGSRPCHFPSGGESALPARGTSTAQVLGWFCCILGHSQPGAMGYTLEFQGVLVPAHSPKV